MPLTVEHREELVLFFFNIYCFRINRIKSNSKINLPFTLHVVRGNDPRLQTVFFFFLLETDRAKSVIAIVSMKTINVPRFFFFFFGNKTATRRQTGLFVARPCYRVDHDLIYVI